jgi:hypothetical protein
MRETTISGELANIYVILPAKGVVEHASSSAGVPP